MSFIFRSLLANTREGFFFSEFNSCAVGSLEGTVEVRARPTRVLFLIKS